MKERIDLSPICLSILIGQLLHLCDHSTPQVWAPVGVSASPAGGVRGGGGGGVRGGAQTGVQARAAPGGEAGVLHRAQAAVQVHSVNTQYVRLVC